MRTKARKDANHQEIVKHFEALGWLVLDIAQLKNCCDIFATKKGITFAIEIKDGSKCPSARKLTSGEKAFASRWKLQGNYRIIESVQDIEDLNNLIKDCDWLSF